jgi:hypothetical protein
MMVVVDNPTHLTPSRLTMVMVGTLIQLHVAVPLNYIEKKRSSCISHDAIVNSCASSCSTKDGVVVMQHRANPIESRIVTVESSGWWH